ncbi:DUF4262 domain-containing protein [Luteimonas sp. SMYT11W]|uniref:DUF4262 domain-containing protein n=1 Tax=Luteimonas flava TaxID=3115822 RepID=A0ABU7WID4_9GAMM
MIRTSGESESEQKVIDDIANFGWHCVNIHPEGEHVGYAFTVGLFKTYGHPELIIFGLSAKVAHQMLSIAADAAKSGAPIDLTKPTDALLNDYMCCFVEVPLSQYYEHVGFCRWYYHGNGFPLYQVVWPSLDGMYPWHDHASSNFQAAQPVIGAVSGGT